MDGGWGLRVFGGVETVVVMEVFLDMMGNPYSGVCVCCGGYGGSWYMAVVVDCGRW